MKRHTINIREASWEIIIWMGSIVVLGCVVLFAVYSYKSVEREMANQFNREQMLLAQQTAMGIEQYMKHHQRLSLTSIFSPLPMGSGRDPHRPQNTSRSLRNKISFVFWKMPRVMALHYPADILPGLEAKTSFGPTSGGQGSQRSPSDIIMVGRALPGYPGRFETFIISFP